MKTNSKARRLMKIRGLLLVLLIGVVSLLELGLSESLAARVNQTTASRTEASPVPAAGIADLMAAMR
jgi:hypothetical protein